jgi:MFS family permease
VRNSLAQRGLIALVLVLAMAVWFSASAVVPALASQWRLSAGGAAWLTAAVQAGFVLGAVVSAVLGLADRMRPQLLAAGCAASAAPCTLAMALFADGPLAAAPLRFATGAFLAGVYPVCMKLMASWSRPTGRALAMGALIGSLALGSALPHLIGGLWRLDWRAVLTAAAAIAFIAAGIAGALVRPGPQFPSGGGTRRPRYALSMFAARGPRLVNLGYFGHMWELYALWTWLPTFFAVSRTTATGLPASRTIPIIAPGVGEGGGEGRSGQVGDQPLLPPGPAGKQVDADLQRGGQAHHPAAVRADLVQHGLQGQVARRPALERVLRGGVVRVEADGLQPDTACRGDGDRTAQQLAEVADRTPSSPVPPSPHAPRIRSPPASARSPSLSPGRCPTARWRAHSCCPNARWKATSGAFSRRPA